MSPKRSGILKRQQALEDIRKIILDQLVPGSVVSESKLEKMLDGRYSRNRINLALIVLERDGLLDVRDSSGTYVRCISDREIKELQRARRVIEEHCVRRLARDAGHNPELAQLKLCEPIRLNNEMRTRLDNANKDNVDEATISSQLAEIDLQFHAALATAAGFPTTFREWLILTQHRFRLLAVPAGGKKSAIEEHQKIIDGTLTGNPAEAAEALLIHLRNARSRWLAKSPDSHS
jgi:DNA-binding GntR family transcriptional regulator